MIQRIKSTAMALRQDLLAAGRIRKVQKKRHGNTVIKVGFLVQMAEIWDKEVDIFDEMNRREEFETVLLVVPPFDYKSRTATVDYQDNYFLKHYDNTIKVVCPDTSVIDLEALDLDYVFYQRPYNEYLPESLRPFEVSRYTKCSFIPYGYSAANNFLDMSTSREFFDSIYFSFFDSRYVQNHCKKRYPVTSHFVHHFLDLGYPCLEQFLCSAPNQGLKNITWTPRWTFSSEAIASNFLKYKDDFLRLFSEHNEFHFVFRPHPLLFDEAENKGYMTRQEIDEYQSALLRSGVRYDSGTLVTDAIKNTDLLITDFSSIVINYFLTGKPVIYCYSEARYTKEYSEMLECCYIARTFRDVERYFNELVKGNDYLKEKRLSLIQKNFLRHQGAAKRIVDTMENDFRKRMKK